MAEQHDRRRARLVLLLEEVAAAHGPHAEHREEVEARRARPGTYCGASPPPPSVRLVPVAAPMSSKTVVRLAPALPGQRRERELGLVAAVPEALVEAHQPVRLLNGSGRSSTARTTEKIAVLAPMPRPRISTTTAANARARSERRKAWRSSKIMSNPVDVAWAL